jgi:hypothetical protein
VVGADVRVAYSWPKQAAETVRALGASLTPHDLMDPGFLRSDSDGVVRFPMLVGFEGSDPPVVGVGLEMRDDGWPFAAWGLSNAEWPAEGPREISVPERAHVEVAILGLPAGGAGWYRDLLGAARTRMDGPPEGRHVSYDATAAKAVAEGAVFPVWMQDLSGGHLSGDPRTLRTMLAAGVPARLVVHSDDEHRFLDLRPDRGGTVRLVRRWDELPRAPRPDGEEDADGK